MFVHAMHIQCAVPCLLAHSVVISCKIAITWNDTGIPYMQHCGRRAQVYMENGMHTCMYEYSVQLQEAVISAQIQLIEQVVHVCAPMPQSLPLKKDQYKEILLTSHDQDSLPREAEGKLPPKPLQLLSKASGNNLLYSVWTINGKMVLYLSKSTAQVSVALYETIVHRFAYTQHRLQLIQHQSAQIATFQNTSAFALAVVRLPPMNFPQIEIPDEALMIAGSLKYGCRQ